MELIKGKKYRFINDDRATNLLPPFVYEVVSEPGDYSVRLKNLTTGDVSEHHQKVKWIMKPSEDIHLCSKCGLAGDLFLSVEERWVHLKCGEKK